MSPAIPAVLGILLSFACADPGGDRGASLPERGPTRVPRADLSRVEPAVRNQLEERAAAVEALIQGGSASSPELAAAFGDLGRHYHAYELRTAAEEGYREALSLAPEEFQWHYYLGFLLQIEGEFQKAAARFEKALAIRPADLPTLLRLGRVRLELSRLEHAQAAFDRALALASSSAEAHHGLARVATARAELEASAKHLHKALELQPQASSLHYSLAQAYRALGEVKKARRHLELRGNIPVHFADPLVQSLDELAVGAGLRLARGGVALAQGRHSAAIEEYRRAVEADPQNFSARLNLGLLLAQADEPETARGHLEEAVRLDPRSVTAHVGLGAAHIRLGQTREAITAYSQALELDPGNSAARLGRATARLEVDEPARAADELRPLVAAEPDNARARLRLGEALQRLGSPEEALEQYRAAAELGLEGSEQAAAELSVANLLAARGDYLAAIDHYRAALANDGQLTQAHFNLAGVLHRLGRHAEAVALYTSALETDPSNATARFYVADELLHQERFEEAARRFAALVAQDPNHERARLGEATALTRLGRYADARERLEAGLAARPESAALAHALAWTLAACPEPSVRDGLRAVELSLALMASAPSQEHAETLATALAQAGRFEEAIEWQRELIGRAKQAGDRARLDALGANLTLYERGQPCCAAAEQPPGRSAH